MSAPVETTCHHALVAATARGRPRRNSVRPRPGTTWKSRVPRLEKGSSLQGRWRPVASASGSLPNVCAETYAPAQLVHAQHDHHQGRNEDREPEGCRQASSLLGSVVVH